MYACGNQFDSHIKYCRDFRVGWRNLSVEGTSHSHNLQRQNDKVSKIAEDDLYKEVIKPLKAEFSDPIVAPHWWKKPADNFKGFAVKTRINNTIWRQWFVLYLSYSDQACMYFIHQYS